MTAKNEVMRHNKDMIWKRDFFNMLLLLWVLTFRKNQIEVLEMRLNDEICERQ